MKTKKLSEYLEAKFNKNFGDKKLYILIGPPSVGKSTWIKNQLNDLNPFIINRDDLVEEVAKSLNWTYDDLFITPDSENPQPSEKYGNIVDSPSVVKRFSKKSYSKVVDANKEVEKKFKARIKMAKDKKVVVVDMTNLSPKTRRKHLNFVGDDYEKIAVVFNFKGSEGLIKKVAKKRAEEIKKTGGSKTLPDNVMDNMFANFKDVTAKENFDRIVRVDTKSDLQKII